MNYLVEKKILNEAVRESSLSYILSDNQMFLPTEYKVLQSQIDGCFVTCMKMLNNGKIELVYQTKNLKSFSSLVPSLDAERFLLIAANIFSDIVDVRQNGFLSCQNIDISFDRIYVDPATYKVSLIYLPLSKHIHEDYSGFENEIRTGLIKLLSGIMPISSPKTIRFAADLSNGVMTIEDILARIKGVKVPISYASKPATGGYASRPATGGLLPNSANSRTLKIIAMNAPNRVEITVTKDSFIIGKKAELCDGVVDFNKMISRTHCRIDRTGVKYTVTDLQSANGTYVNKNRLQPNQPCVIKHGDIVRLANSDFQIRID